MKSQATVELGQALRLVQSETPVPTGKEVLIQISHCGVCHSDVHLHEGYFDLGGGKKLQVKNDSNLPFVLGHEMVGKVLSMGPDASGVEVGRSYAIYPWLGCGKCVTCQSGQEHLCARSNALGITRAGGYADHVLVPDSKYLLDFGTLDPALAACYMCSGITAYSTLRKIEAFAQQGPYLLLGLGGVGMMALQLALKLFEAAPMVADIDERKLDIARQLGVEHAYNLRDEGVFKQIKQDSQGLAGLVDFVGAESTLNPAINCMRQAGKIVVVGLMGGALQMPIPFFPLKALTIQGTYVGSLQEAKELLDLAQKIQLDPIRIELQPLSAANEVLDRLRNGDIVGRVVLQPSLDLPAAN